MQFDLMQINQFWFFAVAGWVNQRQNYALDYLKEENQILRSKITTKRIRFTDRERKDWRFVPSVSVERNSKKLPTLLRPIRCLVGIGN